MNVSQMHYEEWRVFVCPFCGIAVFFLTSNLIRKQVRETGAQEPPEDPGRTVSPG